MGTTDNQRNSSRWGGVVGSASARPRDTEIDEPTVIDEPGTYALTSDIASDAEDSPLQIEADRVALDGNGYKVSARLAPSVIQIDNIKDLTIKNLDVGGGATYYCIRGGGDNMTFRQNSIRPGIDGEGISISGSNNTLENNEYIGPEIAGALHVSGSNNTVRGSSIHSFFRGLSIRGRGNRVENVSIDSDFGTGMSLRGSNNIVRHSQVSSDHGRAAILLFDSNNSTLIQNEIEGGDSGIRLLRSDHNTIVQNDIYGESAGIYEDDGSENNQIRANTIEIGRD